MTVYAPITGRIVPLEQVPDEAFSSKRLGDGVAIESSESKNMIVVSPVEGTIVKFNPNLHAITLESNDGIEVLIHIGVGTAVLKGKGFKAKAMEGQKVKVGTPLVEVDLGYIRKNATSSAVIVLLTNKPNKTISLVGVDNVQAKEELFTYNENIADDTPLDTILHAGRWCNASTKGSIGRFSASISGKAKEFTGDIMLENEAGIKVDSKRIVSLLKLGLTHGAKARFWANDKDVLEVLTSFLENWDLKASDNDSEDLPVYGNWVDLSNYRPPIIYGSIKLESIISKKINSFNGKIELEIKDSSTTANQNLDSNTYKLDAKRYVMVGVHKGMQVRFWANDKNIVDTLTRFLETIYPQTATAVK